MDLEIGREESEWWFASFLEKNNPADTEDGLKA